jgi:excisionase family DNA binding protein
MKHRHSGGTVDVQARPHREPTLVYPATRQRWVTVRDVAEMLSTTPRTVYRMIENGELPGTKFGRSVRVPLDRLERWIEQKEQEAMKENDYGKAETGDGRRAEGSRRL